MRGAVYHLCRRCGKRVNISCQLRQEKRHLCPRCVGEPWYMTKEGLVRENWQGGRSDRSQPALAGWDTSRAQKARTTCSALCWETGGDCEVPGLFPPRLPGELSPRAQETPGTGGFCGTSPTRRTGQGSGQGLRGRLRDRVPVAERGRLGCQNRREGGNPIRSKAFARKQRAIREACRLNRKTYIVLNVPLAPSRK